MIIKRHVCFCKSNVSKSTTLLVKNPSVLIFDGLNFRRSKCSSIWKNFGTPLYETTI